jgi:hypothetical protein
MRLKKTPADYFYYFAVCVGLITIAAQIINLIFKTIL